MEILLNNRETTIPNDKVTITELLLLQNFTFKMLVIKINGKLIKKEQYGIVEIVSGDTVQVLHMVSGG